MTENRSVEDLFCYVKVFVEGNKLRTPLCMCVCCLGKRIVTHTLQCSGLWSSQSSYSLFVTIVPDRTHSYRHTALSEISNRIVGNILLNTVWYHALFFFLCGGFKYCSVYGTVWCGDEVWSANCVRTMCFVTRSHIDGTSLLAIRPRPWDTSLQAVRRPMCLDNRNPTVGSVCPGSSIWGRPLAHLVTRWAAE